MNRQEWNQNSKFHSTNLICLSERYLTRANKKFFSAKRSNLSENEKSFLLHRRAIKIFTENERVGKNAGGENKTDNNIGEEQQKIKMKNKKIA